MAFSYPQEWKRAAQIIPTVLARVKPQAKADQSTFLI